MNHPSNTLKSPAITRLKGQVHMLSHARMQSAQRQWLSWLQHDDAIETPSHQQHAVDSALLQAYYSVR